MFALTNAEIETITKGRISGGTVVVKDGKIASVGRRVRIPEGVEVIDVEGRLVTPGLIEAHSHAGMEGRLGSIERGKDADLVVWDGDPLDVRSKPEKVFIRGRLVDVIASRRALFDTE